MKAVVVVKNINNAVNVKICKTTIEIGCNRRPMFNVQSEANSTAPKREKNKAPPGLRNHPRGLSSAST
jgi:hypothetical protein